MLLGMRAHAGCLRAARGVAGVARPPAGNKAPDRKRCSRFVDARGRAWSLYWTTGREATPPRGPCACTLGFMLFVPVPFCLTPGPSLQPGLWSRGPLLTCIRSALLSPQRGGPSPQQCCKPRAAEARLGRGSAAQCGHGARGRPGPIAPIAPIAAIMGPAEARLGPD